MPVRKFIIATIAYMIFNCGVMAQSKTDTEFRKGWLLLGKMQHGLVTNFHRFPPDMYMGGLSLNPQCTVAPGLLRLGANTGFVYSNKQLSGLFGPMVALKIKNFNAGSFGGLANLHLLAEANWGTNDEQLAGGGIAIELLTKLHIGLTAQRDYNLNYWWFQSFIGIKLNKKKRVKEEYE